MWYPLFCLWYFQRLPSPAAEPRKPSREHGCSELAELVKLSWNERRDLIIRAQLGYVILGAAHHVDFHETPFLPDTLQLIENGIYCLLLRLLDNDYMKRIVWFTLYYHLAAVSGMTKPIYIRYEWDMVFANITRLKKHRCMAGNEKKRTKSLKWIFFWTVIPVSIAMHA
jgi:hypothetical protein